MRSIWLGPTPFVNSKRSNPFLPIQVDLAGGMRQLIRSIPSRNTWRICDKFGILPNDEHIQKLTIAQREWVIQNMELDIKEQKAAAEGKEITADIQDDSESYDKDVMQTSNAEFVNSLQDSSDIEDWIKQESGNEEATRIIEREQHTIDEAYDRLIKNKDSRKKLEEEKRRKEQERQEKIAKYFNK